MLSTDSTENPLDVDTDDSVQQYGGGVEEKHSSVKDIESQNEEDIYSEELSHVLRTQEGVERIASLTRTMSVMTKAELSKFEVNDSDFSLKALLRYLHGKSEEQGILSSAAGVAFKGITATGVDISAAYGPSVEEMVRDIVSWPAKLFTKKHTPTREIIQDVTGYIESGEMCLVLGRPGSGCTSLLKCIGGETGGFLSVDGEFSYDGIDQHEMIKRFKSYVLYNPELDIHFPHLSVKNTIDFVLKTKTPSTRVDGISRGEYIDTMRDLWATVFGLRHTYATNVGNDFVRGVSGGERKRVSIVEALSTNSSIYCFDNATRGLDASTALEFTQALRAATNLLKNSSFIAIYQAGENIYELFDKVTVMYLGRQIYFGPATEAKKYFQKMGYFCPSRMTTPEFLTSVTDPNGRFVQEGFEGKVPSSSEEFELYWKASPEYNQLLQDIARYESEHPTNVTRERFELALHQQRQSLVRNNSIFIASYFNQVWYLMIRGFQRFKGEMLYQTIYLSSFLIKGLVVGSMFYNIPKDTTGAFSRTGLLFYVSLFCAITSLAEISHSFDYRPIILKQKSYTMYHTSAEALQQIFTEVPSKFVAIVIFSLTTYWIPLLKHQAGPFFAFFIFLLIVQQCMSFFFKVIACLTKDGGTAHAIAGLAILLMCIYSGFVVPLPEMHHWWKWFNWINPFRYAMEELFVNEFHGRKMPCASLVPSGPGYENVSLLNQICAVDGAKAGLDYVLGDAYLSKKFDFKKSHLWRNFGIMFAWTFGFIILNVILSEYVKQAEGGGDMLLYKRGHLPDSSNETKDAKVASREEMMLMLNGEGVDLEEVIASRDVFTWKNLDYVIPYDGAQRQLLNDIQGYVKPGTMTALMGESGAGKTTLLNVLSQRINFGVITGDMLVNARPVDPSFQRRTGYVQQQDLHLAEYSVRESLRFAAYLRQPASVSKQEKDEYVEKIIYLLGMQNYAEAIIGKIGLGLNVEQRKKLSIGVELVAKPDLLLFLDEPTSGLDSQSAWSIIQFLRALADSGQAILCTIHQPSATLFEVFDRLLLLKKGGRTVYFGDIGPNSSTMLQYFERQSGVACGKSENPAEYILNCIGAGATASASADWGDLWLDSPECAKEALFIDELHRELPNRPVRGDTNLNLRFAASFATQFRWVFSRTRLQFWRSPIYLRAKFLESVICSLFIGFSFVKLNHSLASGQDPLLAVFMLLVVSIALINQMHVFAYASRELYEVRERSSNTFHWSVLLLVHSSWEIIYCFACQFICFVCFFFPMGVSATPRHAGYFFFVYVCIFPIYYVTYGLWILYFSPDVPSAAMINSNLFSAMLLFCGILQPESFMPGFWTFMYKVSPFTYFVQSFVAPMTHDRVLRCKEREFLIMDPPAGKTCGEYLSGYVKNSGGYINNPKDTSDCHYCEYTYQAQVLEPFGISFHKRWRNVGFFFAYIIFNYVAMLGCYWIMRVKVWSLKSVLDVTSWWKGPRKERHEPSTNVFKPQPGDANTLKPKSA